MDFIRLLGGRPSVFFSLSLFLSPFLPFPTYPPTPLGVPPSSALSRPLLNCLPLIFTPVPLRYGPSAGQALRDICGAARVGRIKSREGRKGKKKRAGGAEEYPRSRRYAPLPTTISRRARRPTVLASKSQSIARSSFGKRIPRAHARRFREISDSPEGDSASLSRSFRHSANVEEEEEEGTITRIIRFTCIVASDDRLTNGIASPSDGSNASTLEERLVSLGVATGGTRAAAYTRGHWRISRVRRC